MATPDLLARIAGRRVVASISGGKDSAAMSLWLTEQGIEHDRVFLDTGWEHEVTYGYLRGELTRAIGPITELRGKRGMVDLIKHKGMFPSRTVRFCTQELKVYPMQRYIRARADAGEDLVNAVGIRRGESQARAHAQEWEWSEGFDCEVWRPLVEWSAQDVIDIHRRHGLRPNPLYLLGAKRVGCWPCIFSAKEEIRQVADLDPDRIAVIRALEAEVNAISKARAAAKGKELATARHFFRVRVPGVVAASDFVPIDRVVEWSRTARGGRQALAFSLEPPDAGCMRWGLCETVGG